MRQMRWCSCGLTLHAKRLEEAFRERLNRDPGVCFCKNPGKHPEPVTVPNGYVACRRSVFGTSRKSCYLGIDQIMAFVGRHRSVGATHGKLEELGNLGVAQRYTYRVLQTIQMKLILLCVWAEPAILGSAKTALKFK